MGRHAVIGTAGHVDHGKTALVQALTGVDTDRWEEEKRRGITIDLGFAHLTLSDDVSASIVDVPGHEDFVRNMVAGATGVDIALLVVAADEGIMPQTIEHLAILEFLGVGTGVVAVTKSDLAEPDWMELVLDDLAERLDDTTTRWSPAVPVSSKTGQGMDELRAALLDAADNAITRDAEDLFRMPVDRVFSVAGAGTVVTGTAWAGTVRPGDEVRLLPGDEKSRVRGVEVHGKTASKAEPGRRTAISLVGVDRNALGRGCTVVGDASWRATRALDVAVSLLPSARVMTQRTRVRVHVGTAEVMARVTPAHGDIHPGGKGVARLRLEHPLVCRWGDRGVLRSYSPVTTVGGFEVIDPWPAARPRRPREHPGRQSSEALDRVESFVKTEPPGTVSLVDLPVRLAVRPVELDNVMGELTQAGVTNVDGVLFPESTVGAIAQSALEALHRFHRAGPLESGMSMEEFRRAAGGPATADYVRERLVAEQRIEVSAATVRLTGFAPTLQGANAEYGRIVEARIEASGHQGIVPAGMEPDVPPEPAQLLAEFFVRQGTAVRIGNAPARYYSRSVLDQLSRTVVEEIKTRGQVSPADLREALGLSRKYLIPLLEWLDGQQITMRVGDARRLGAKAQKLQ